MISFSGCQLTVEHYTCEVASHISLYFLSTLKEIFELIDENRASRHSYVMFELPPSDTASLNLFCTVDARCALMYQGNEKALPVSALCEPLATLHQILHRAHEGFTKMSICFTEMTENKQNLGERVTAYSPNYYIIKVQNLYHYLKLNQYRKVASRLLVRPFENRRRPYSKA